MSSQNSPSEQGCMIALAAIAIAMVAQAIIAFLIQLLYILLVVAAVGGVGYLLYKVEMQTGQLSRFFDNLFSGINLSMEEKNGRYAHHIQQQQQGLPEPREDKLLDTLASLDATLSRFNDRMDLQDKKIQAIEDRLPVLIEEALEKRDKKNWGKELDLLFNQPKSEQTWHESNQL